MSTTDFLDSWIKETPKSELNRRYFEIEDRYAALFGHRVPTELLPTSISDDILITCMETCIREKQDKLFDLLGVTVDKDVLY